MSRFPTHRFCVARLHTRGPRPTWLASYTVQETGIDPHGTTLFLFLFRSLLPRDDAKQVVDVVIRASVVTVRPARG